MAADPLDAKLLAAWQALPDDQRVAIAKALEKPTHIGAMLPPAQPKHIRTPLGYVVFDRFVTGLARQMIEAAAWNEEAA